MNLHWIDWAIIALTLVALVAIAAYATRYTKSVADFLAANRLAGRYMLTVASPGLTGGACAFVAAWEATYSSGLPPLWWAMIATPVGLIIGLSGFATYRLRETRALTLAQFLEMRYSRSFRYFAGGLSWISGVVNYGIFPLINARLILYFFGFPEQLHLGGHPVQTLPLVMGSYLLISFYIACSGGQISIMISDFFQGVLVMIVFLVLMCFLMARFQWNDLFAGLQLAPEGKSMFNPFQTGNVEDFNLAFVLIGIFSSIYNIKSWQGSSGYNSAAKTPHEAQMAGVISQWRTVAQALCMVLIPLAAYAVFHLPKFAEMAAPIQSQIATIADPQIRQQMTVPLFLAAILPVGLIGFVAAVILSAAIVFDSMYLHSWGSIFVQDVLLPIRNKPLDATTHVRWLRISITGVALFGFCFSMLFPLKDFIFMFFALTGAIYMGGAGAVILGGLYWKRGTTPAAWTALILGTVLAFGGMLIQTCWQSLIAPMALHLWPDWQWLAAHQEKFPLNGQWIYFYAMLASSLSYVLVSLLGPRQVCDMDMLLHRGKYAVREDQVEAGDALVVKRRTLGEILGISREFTRFDRFVFWASFWWSMAWWGIFLVGLLVNFYRPITDAHWSFFWWLKIWFFSLILGIVCTFWFLGGGIRDAFRLFRDLKAEKVNEKDDGTVTEHAISSQEGPNVKATPDK